MIHYNKVSNNCGHHAVKRLNEIWGLDIKFADGQEWQLDFWAKLRKDFTKLDKPCEGCLVVMTQLDGGLHLGIFTDFQVEHNYQPLGEFNGCVILSDIGTIRAEYTRIRYYAPNQAA